MKKRISLKETRLFVAMALLVQSVSFFIMFIILCAKKKSIAAAFLAVSAMGGSTAGYLLWQLKAETDREFDAAKEALENDEYLEFDEDRIAADLAHGTANEEEEDPEEIPCEENVSEEEFN